MATAAKRQTTELRPTKVTKVVLELSELEADLLNEVLSRVGGDAFGPRGHVDDIGKALRHATSLPFGGNEDRPEQITGSITIR